MIKGKLVQFETIFPDGAEQQYNIFNCCFMFLCQCTLINYSNLFRNVNVGKRMLPLAFSIRIGRYGLYVSVSPLLSLGEWQH